MLPVTAVVVAFAGFSAGVVAHASAEPAAPPAPEAPAPRRRRLRLAAGLLLTAVIAACVVVAGQEYLGLRRGLLPGWLEWVVLDLDSLLSFPAPPAWVQLIAEAKAVAGDAMYWFPALAAPWLLWRVVTRRGGSAEASLDALGRSRAAALRFLVLWPALTILCVCALPILAVAGVLLFHAVLAPIPR